MKYTHIISLIFGSVVSLVTLASAQVPNILSYQGRIVAGGVNFDGTGQFKFALVDDGTTTTPTTRNASGTAVVNSGFITGITVTDGGVGYNSIPTVTITGGGGSGATATAVISGGAVTEFTIISPGSSYNSAPLVNVGGQDEWPTNYVTYWSNDGTSTAGSEPASAIDLPVSKGLFSVKLGDPTLTNMSAITDGVISESDLHLRIWFNDGVRGWQKMAPDTQLLPAFAAIKTKIQAGIMYSLPNTVSFYDSYLGLESKSFGVGFRAFNPSPSTKVNLRFKLPGYLRTDPNNLLAFPLTAKLFNNGTEIYSTPMTLTRDPNNPRWFVEDVESSAGFATGGAMGWQDFSLSISLGPVPGGRLAEVSLEITDLQLVFSTN